ncbi:MAG: hypothetical protein SFV55_00135 [Haliscomenobacter sp.]|uniref:hypothetical protein n=1 Tax=Haliscomenobacter sp. TaxID=2717303 RepID=UPI0029B673D3|nr:hypothetical protein [Haliscomenobacter sp.]MDX2066796.1 hypothetical protein [Haliscomenobacter sp.]
MDIAFWVLWVIDLLLTFIVIMAAVYRENAGAFNNDNFTYAIVLMLILVGSIVVRYVLQWPLLGVLLAALPVMIVLVLYFFDL